MLRVLGRLVAAAFVLFALAAGALAWWWTRPPDAGAELRREHAPLASVTSKPLGGDAPGLERWTLRDARGRSVRAIWRPAARGTREAWTVVLLGGLHTGERAAMLAPGSLPVNVLAVDWPWEGSRTLSPRAILRQAPAIRASLLRSPSALALGVEAARRARPGTPVALMGVSLGVPPAVAALRLSAPEAVLLADGGADLGAMATPELGRWLPWPLSVRPGPRLVGSLGARLLDPLEPSRHAAAARETPVLLLEASDDTRIPRHCRDRLRAAFPHAEVRVHARDHVRGIHAGSVEEIARDAHRWLLSL